MDPTPGWYPDRRDPSRLRYWDGTRWSDQTQPNPSMAPGPWPGATPPPHPPPHPLLPPLLPPPPPKGGGRRGVLLGVMAVVAALVLGGAAIAFALASGDDGAEQTSATSPVEPTDGGGALGPGGTVAPETAAEVADPPSADCPSTGEEPGVRRIWQDEAGTHVVVVIRTTCPVDQVLAGSEVRFGLFLGADHLVTGTFDLSSDPLAVPAGGTSGELELVFDAEADADPVVRSRVFLPTSEASAQPLGFDLRYVIDCEPGDGGSDSVLVESRSGANLDDAPAVGGEGEDPSTPDGVDASDADALAMLEEIHAAQAGQRAAMTDRWVPQVSAKRLDDDATVDVITGQTIVHTPAVFLDRFRAWDARYPGRAVLFRGSDAFSICGDRRTPECLGLWVVAIDEPQADEFAVFDGWCEAERLNYLDGVRITDSTELHCIARRFGPGPPSENSYAG